MTVDFHVHSTGSDGTLTPSEIVSLAVSKDCQAMALTDHDSVDGLDEFRSAAAAVGLRVLSGLELSIDPGAGFDTFHLLGYGVDPDSPVLRQYLARVLAARNARNVRIAANFRRLGIELEEDVRHIAQGNVLARPHYAKWLIEHGYAADKYEAFAKYLLPDSPDETRCYESRWHPSQEESIATIHAAGGLCVMAHPKLWKRAWRTTGPDYALAERELARLKELGLDGLEAIYQMNTVDESVAFSRLADRLGLLKTAGSDFHGANKPDVPFGQTVSEAFIRPFLDQLTF